MKKIYILDTFKVSSVVNPYLKYHINRTFQACLILNPFINKKNLTDIYLNLMNQNVENKKCRLRFNPQDLTETAIEFSDIDPLPELYTLSFARTFNSNIDHVLSSYKTSLRQYWTENLKNISTVDVIGFNQNQFITDTSRFNIFILDQNQFYTPSLKSGCLNGCFRQYCLDQKLIALKGVNYPLYEKDYTKDQITNKKIYLGNSLRGIISSELKIDRV